MSKSIYSFLKPRVNLYLLEIQKLETILCFKFNKLIICFTPSSKRYGNILFKGDKLFVNVIISDFKLLHKNFCHNSQNIMYKPEREIQDYQLCKLKYMLEYI